MAGEPSRDLDEHGITGCVPGVVVDLLEPVQVEQEQTDQAMVPGCARQRVGQPVPQHDPVGQAGQRVLERLTEQLVLQGLPVGDVPGVPEESAELSIGQLVRDGGLQRQRPPVVVPDLELDMGRVVGVARIAASAASTTGRSSGWIRSAQISSDAEPSA